MRVSNRFAMKANLAATWLWVALVVPTVTVWNKSILWVGFISIWANVVSHYTAFEAAKVAVKEDDLEQKVSGN